MHATIRATLLSEIIKLIQEKYNWTEEQAMDAFYSSSTGENFSDDDTGLYGQSALYIFGIFEQEMKASINSQAE